MIDSTLKLFIHIPVQCKFLLVSHVRLMENKTKLKEKRKRKEK